MLISLYLLYLNEIINRKTLGEHRSLQVNLIGIIFSSHHDTLSSITRTSYKSPIFLKSTSNSYVFNFVIKEIY